MVSPRCSFTREYCIVAVGNVNKSVSLKLKQFIWIILWPCLCTVGSGGGGRGLSTLATTWHRSVVDSVAELSWGCKDNGGPYFYEANTCWFSIKWHHCLVRSNGGAHLHTHTGPPISVCGNLLFKLWAWCKVLFCSQKRFEREGGHMLNFGFPFFVSCVNTVCLLHWRIESEQTERLHV